MRAGARALQVRALRAICTHLGMLPLTPEVAARNRARIGEDRLAWAVMVLASDAPGWKRACAMLALDLVSPDWLDAAGPQLMGFNVERASPLVRAWRDSVLERDGHACTRCGSGAALHAHHVVRWADDPSQRLLIDNGVTLCQPCHIEEHRRG